MVDSGWELEAVKSPQLQGGSPSYKLRIRSDVPRGELEAIEEKCSKLRTRHPQLTDAEIRVVYDRWVGERKCLVELGYQPVDPPSFETFLSTWKTGPWSPTDGVDTNAWTATEYETAKKKCTLEFYDRE